MHALSSNTKAAFEWAAFSGGLAIVIALIAWALRFRRRIKQGAVAILDHRAALADEAAQLRERVTELEDEVRELVAENSRLARHLAGGDA